MDNISNNNFYFMYLENMILFFVDLYLYFVKYFYSYRYIDLFVFLFNVLV